MALIYDAELSPSKPEILRAWVPAQPWFPGSELEIVGAFRFDDPAGEVGIETHLVRAGGRDFQVPLTYRGAPLPGGTLIATMEHSVLGPRWVYDGCSDPVYVAAVSDVIRAGGSQADLEFADGSQAPAPAVQVRGSSGQGSHLIVHRLLDAARVPAGPHLSGTWPGQDSPAVLAEMA